jgi:hypothetical protein
MGLRAWARNLLKDNEVVAEWWANKHGEKERVEAAAREKHKGAIIRATALATKNAKQKKK